MREMVFRDRMEKVAHVRAIAGLFARMTNMDVDNLFGGVIAEYASEVFQESYDPTLLQQKAERLRHAQQRVRKRREDDLKAIQRLERMEKLGEEFDKNAKRNSKHVK